MLAALALPSLCVFNTGPMPSLYNQVIALILWGGLVRAINSIGDSALRKRVAALNCWLIAGAVLTISALFSVLATGLPVGPAVCEAVFCVAAAAVALTGVAANGSSTSASGDWTVRFVWAVFVTAVLNCLPAVLQTLRPDWIDGTWLAPPWSSDRISGNVRQPNLLATLLVCGVAAAAALIDLRRLRLHAGATASLLLLATIAATGSRVGALGVVGLAVWALVDRRMSSPTRKGLVAAPFVLIAVWALLQWWSHSSGLPHGREADLASGRYTMWRQCLTLISAHPWFGVGLGNFNFTWTLTPFDRTNPETFDHAHNLLLHWAVELGIPTTVLLLGLLGCSLWKGVQRARQTRGEESTVRRFCLVLIAAVLLHSMTEYPLWYAYFLLPMAFAWGVAAAPPHATAKADPELRSVAAGRAKKGTWLGTTGLLMALGAAFSAYDYQKIVAIYHPWDGAPPQEERIATGRKALLYGYLADRFAGTLAVAGTRTLQPYQSATRQLLDMRLLIAWSLAMRESGDLDKARYLAQRVLDFNDPVARQFFIGCKPTMAAGIPAPWQCLPPAGHYTYKDFL